MTQPTYDPTAVAALHGLADHLAANHLPTPNSVVLYRHDLSPADFDAAVAEHHATVKHSGAATFAELRIETAAFGSVRLTLFLKRP